MLDIVAGLPDRGVKTMSNIATKVKCFVQSPNTMLEVVAGLPDGGVKTMSNIATTVKTQYHTLCED
jgi:hypothetical protein